jgi:TonB family protein
MRVIGVLRGLVLAIGAFALAATASADIKSFNAAMKAKDYEAATAAAASTWPGLDKSRKDIAVIAREFALAAYLSGDFAAAHTYAQAAVAGGNAAGEDQASRIASDMLLHMADLKVTESGEAREGLFKALQASSAMPGIDIVSYLAANVLVSHDLSRDRWTSLRASAALAETMTGRGASYAADSYRYELVGAMAQFMDDRDMGSYNGLLSLSSRLREAINKAPTDEAASALVPLFWETEAWSRTVASALRAGKDFSSAKVDGVASLPPKPGDRAARLLYQQRPVGVCQVVRSADSPKARYPASARFQGLVGTVLLSLDLDAAGRVTKAVVLAAAPEKNFGDAALQAAQAFIYVPSPQSPQGCTLAQENLRLNVEFMIRAR